MPQCFVIQPFDKGKYDKRYEDIFKPAIERAGCVAYRVDEDLDTDIIIQAIERKITESEVCFAEISEDNPNVWYELGYANAKQKGMCLVCSNDRSASFPFDIAHQSIIKYNSESTSDFNRLRESITERIKALLKKEKSREVLSNMSHTVKVEGLGPHESSAMIVLGDSILDPEGVSVYPFYEKMMKSGFTRIASQLAAKALLDKGFIEKKTSSDDFGNEFPILSLTDDGIAWLMKNQDKFELTVEYQEKNEIISDDDIPF